MAPKGKKKLTVKLEDLFFYFDGVERQRLDGSGWSRRSAEVLALREELLKLPETAYEAAIKTMKNVVSDRKSSDDPSVVQKAKQKAAAKLFAAVQDGRSDKAS